MITIFAIKPFTGNPADGIDNVNISVFSRVNKDKFTFLVETSNDFKEKGSIKKMELKNRNRLFGFLAKIILLRRLKPDYLFGNGGINDIPFIIFKPSATKYLIDWHTVLVKDEGFWQVRTPWLLRKFIFNRADLIIAVSEFSAQSVKKYFPNKNVIGILNGVDLEFFNPNKRNQKYLSEKYKIDFSKPLVVFIGALHPRKRPDLFIELVKDYQEANFAAIGRQMPPADFLSSVKDLKNFQWIEKMLREDIAILLASSKILAFPSLNEASAAVILEAMASGCVPIISKSGGNTEFLKDGESGFLIEVDDFEEKEFFDKIDLLIKNSSLWNKMSQVSRQEAENHSWDKIAKQYEEIFA